MLPLQMRNKTDRVLHFIRLREGRWVAAVDVAKDCGLTPGAVSRRCRILRARGLIELQRENRCCGVWRSVEEPPPTPPK